MYQRLKLIDLIQPAQDAFLEDRITAGHAILMARLQPKDQHKALEECFQDDWGYKAGARERHLIGVRKLSEWIQENIHLDLHAAPFKKDAEALVPQAGPCTTCPKRTGFLPQLFPDIAKKDTCTDRNCFEEKLQAHIVMRRAQLQAKGEQVLEVTSEYSSNHKASPGDPLPASKYHEIQDKKDRCESMQKAVVVAGYRDRGKVLDVCTDPKCKKHGSRGAGSSSRNDRWEGEQKRQEVLKQRKRAVRIRILESSITKVKWPLSRQDLEEVAIGFWNDLWSDLQKAIIARRGWEKDKKKGGYGISYDAIIRKHLPEFSDDQLAGFLMELSVARQIDGLGYGASKDRLLELAKLHKIDVKSIEKQVSAEIAEKEKTRKKKAGKSAKKPKPSSTGKKQEVPACEVCGCTEDRACTGGCSWDPEFRKKKRWVCSNCADEAEVA